MPSKRPNILFLMTDHQRSDSIGMVQCGREVTPNLNRLASGGISFTRAYNTCPLCVPARTALATGIYPTANGVVYNDWNGRTASDFKPIHQYLHEAGYSVAHIGVDHIKVDPGLRERVAFDTWVSAAEYSAYAQKQNLPQENSSGFKDTVYEHVRGEIRKTAYSNTETGVCGYESGHFMDLFYCREAVRFLEEERAKPFALFLCLWAPHPPLRVPEPYASMYDPASILLPPNTGLPSEGEPAGRIKGAAAQIGFGKSETQWRRVWAAHLGLVSLADAGLGTVLDLIDRKGLAENTLTVFTVDHGDHLGQHRMYQKMEMYEPAVHIPLVIRGCTAGPGKISTPVSHLDIVPTLLDLLDLEPEKNLDGRSLACTLETGAEPEPAPVFSQYSGNPDVGDIRRMAVSGNFKYVYTPGDRAELYDLENDTLEMKNLEGNPVFAKKQNELRLLCADWHRKHNDWVSYD